MPAINKQESVKGKKCCEKGKFHDNLYTNQLATNQFNYNKKKKHL